MVCTVRPKRKLKRRPRPPLVRVIPRVIPIFAITTITGLPATKNQNNTSNSRSVCYYWTGLLLLGRLCGRCAIPVDPFLVFPALSSIVGGGRGLRAVTMDNPRARVARVAAGSTSSAGSSHSSGSSDAVVCGTCGDHLVNLRGHQIHCGRHARCKGAAAIPIEQWRADRRSESQRKALAAIGNEAFVDNEAATINSELQGMYYEHMATATDVQKVTTMLRAHDERCKDEVVRRLSAGRLEA